MEKFYCLKVTVNGKHRIIQSTYFKGMPSKHLLNQKFTVNIVLNDSDYNYLCRGEHIYQEIDDNNDFIVSLDEIIMNETNTQNE